MTDHHHFILTNFDAHTIDLEPFQYAGTNITAVRLVDPENEILQKFTGHLTEPEPTTTPSEAEAEADADPGADADAETNANPNADENETKEPPEEGLSIN